ncbi:amino acid permease [Acinetobacter pittii]|uniref:amino acid permease n=1 Tax=Acinetobacter pittii TaxID=48296 RepID=UPI0029FF67AC|nr:amino acid permease [Acinetobacter pittii]MDX8223478.1 amino acid permease [Acinetobacter pittii]WPP74611.1 amino acid permease [Acinetobacter pittii]
MNNDTTKKLGEGLSNRHITMISIGGVIGAGLFVGSSSAIAKAGPAVILAYLITSIMVFLVMRMLGEMAVLEPDTGSFSTYARKAIGPWAGFTIGWLYWWFWVLAIPVEAIAGAEILHSWFPNVSVSISGVANLYNNAGFMPHGMGGILSAILITAFSFFGVEIVSIAAAESSNPKQKIRRATNLVLYRIILFFVVSMFIAVSLVDWHSPDLQKYGTFQYVLMSLNVPGTKLIIDTVVFIAVASCMNAAIYTSSRMLFRLGTRSEAPQAVTKINYAGVPAIAVFSSTFIGLVCCVINYVFPGKVFGLLLSSTGSIALLVYLVIAFSQLRLRHKLEAAGAEIPFKMWLFPWLTWFVIIIILSVLAYMFFSPAYSYETTLSLGVTSLVVVCGLFVTRKRKATRAVAMNLD